MIGGTSAGAAIQSRTMIAGGQAEPLMGVGFDLLPWTIIDQHFLARERQARFAGQLRTIRATSAWGSTNTRH